MEYEILNILEFTSTRKRMSVICRGPDGGILLYCKGADTVVYERLDPSYRPNQWMKKATGRHMDDFGGAGLRTLCLAYAELDPRVYDAWQHDYIAAKTSLENREAKVDAVAEAIERDLRLLGCTAIEDKLQAGVPRCIAQLKEAGIRIWVLTGDKQETAINVGFACCLLHDDMVQYIVTADLPDVVQLEDSGQMARARALAGEKVHEQLRDALAHMREERGDDPEVAAPPKTERALIIEGKALGHALSAASRRLFVDLATACDSVICCRVSPKQKGEVTGLVKGTGRATLAVGDGANDVGMIQEAHIGVGISGQEGMQAVMSSDFAIGQFRFLEPLLLIHGRWCYKRICHMVSFFLYKNLFLGLTIFAYNAICLFSGQIIYDDFYMSLYNVTFTSLAPLAVGLLDQDVSKGASLRYPGLYRQGQRNEYFSVWAIFTWFVHGFAHAGVTTAIVFAATSVHADRSSGETHGHWQTGTMLFSAVVVTVHAQLVCTLETWTALHHVAIWGGVAIWFLYLVFTSEVRMPVSPNIHSLFVGIAAPSAKFWLIVALCPVASVLPGFFGRSVRRLIAPADHQIVQEIERRKKVGGRKRRKSSSGKTISLEQLPSIGVRHRYTSTNRGCVPGDAPGSASYFTPQTTLDQMHHESHMHPVVAKLEKELSLNPYRHRFSNLSEEHGVCEDVGASSQVQFFDRDRVPVSQESEGFRSRESQVAHCPDHPP
eukprot:evm.model.scf_1059.1 EVM.evm.TU.scf_1059.1   scf_1059:98-2784(-)